jgi:hypothetical protein
MTLPGISVQDSFRALLDSEYPLRRPENSYRIFGGRADIRNHFIPDLHEQLNRSATFILEHCDGEHSIIDIWRRMAESFEIDDTNTALCEVVRLIRYMQCTHVLYSCTRKDEQQLDPYLMTGRNGPGIDLKH